MKLAQDALSFLGADMQVVRQDLKDVHKSGLAVRRQLQGLEHSV